MQLTRIEEDVQEFVVSNFLFGQSADLNRQDSLLEKGVLDSNGVLELIAFLEEHYSITIHDDEVIPDNLDSVAKISDFAGRKLRYNS